MKIIDIQRFINKFNVLTEAVTLPQIRRGILGKDREYPIVDDDKEWYEEHKSEILSTIEKALNVDDKTLKIKLQKFDTDDFFTNDKPRKLKVRELLKAVRRNFISQIERSRNIEEKTSGIEAQYEMMEMKNGVEVYAVYTPKANRYLTHTKLWVQGCFSPTWCIASSTANNHWNNYNLYEADFPSVFIVAQKTENGYNPVKYELKCDPHDSVSFKKGEISLENWVDEWREPEQNEETYDETSLFKNFDIDYKDLENTIRKLVNSKKAEDFSKKYGVDMMNLYTKKIITGDEDTKMEYLTKACKNGTIVNFYHNIDKEDKEYFLDELIRYGTLTEDEVLYLRLMYKEKAISFLIKNKRCTHLSLEWANFYFDGNMVRRVYHSLPDEILSSENIGDINVRRKIFENIKNVKGLTEEFLNYQFKNGKVNNTTLEYVRHDETLLKKCLDSMYENSNLNGKTLRYVRNNKELFAKYLERIIESDNVDFVTINYEEVQFNNKLLSRCLISLVKNEKINSEVFYLILQKRFYHFIKPAIKAAIKKRRINEKFIEAFEIVGEDKENPEVREGLSLIIKALSSQDDDDIDWSYILKKLIEEKFTENIKEVYNLLLNSCSDEYEQQEKVNELIEYASRNLDPQMYGEVEKLIVDGGIYDEDTLFEMRNEKYISEMLINLDKNDELQGYYLDIVNHFSNESLKYIISTILNLKSFDIIDYIFGREDQFDHISRFLGVILENGYHLSCDVLKSLLEINFDDEEILEKIISDNIKENKEKVIQILSEHDKEYLLK